jgi:hypothetical protein
MIMDQFASSDLFTEPHCSKFMTFLPMLAEGALFKLKKHMIPCLLSIARHLPQETKLILSTVVKFHTDPIWGVRKVLIEQLPRIAELMTDQQSLLQCLSILEAALKDESKWVRSQALH